MLHLFLVVNGGPRSVENVKWPIAIYVLDGAQLRFNLIIARLNLIEAAVVVQPRAVCGLVLYYLILDYFSEVLIVC